MSEVLIDSYGFFKSFLIFIYKFSCLPYLFYSLKLSLLWHYDPHLGTYIMIKHLPLSSVLTFYITPKHKSRGR